MIRKAFPYILGLFAFVTLLLLPGVSFAQPISGSELVNNASLYDGKTVVYEGEVIGDIMARGKFAWINISDGKIAVGVWLDRELTRNILYTASYRTKGDWVEISGTFQRSCQRHGGDLDIHALGIKKISSGRKISERLNPAKRNMVFVLSGALCLVLILTLLKRR